MEKIATHPGTVTHVEKGRVVVQMRVLSACASCEAHGKCGFADAKDKIVEVDTRDWQQYQPGDHVTVIIQSGNGMKAVFIAYVMPGLLLLGSFIGFYLLQIGDGLTALLSLLVVGLYGLILYLLRDKLQKKFTFRLKREE
jgi:sigma-E factor negative regulatory protein RseC